MNFIDLKKQYQRIKNDIDNSVFEVLDNANFIQGDQVKKLEKKLSEYTGNNCVTCANGTDALYVALRSLDIKEGDDVIVPSFTWVSTAEVVKLVNANPVFADIEENSFNVSVKSIEQVYTPNTKAIIPVSMFGKACNLEEINKYAKAKNVTLIEDAAQSFGAKSNGSLSCSVADISTTSFFPAKPLGCYGDGGAIFVRNEELFEKISAITKHGQKGRYNYVDIGVNSRLDTIQAAILLEKIKVYEDEIIKRNIVADKYNELLSSTSYLNIPESTDPNNRSVWAQYTLKLSKEIAPFREQIMGQLKRLNIPTALYYPAPIHQQKPYLSNAYLPNTESISQRVLSLPMHPYLSVQEIEEISEKLLSVCETFIS
tara:strand:- start:5743 stop:6855 length:1113 start_codon:yes stop_codon:yes gene_type:complete